MKKNQELREITGRSAGQTNADAWHGLKPNNSAPDDPSQPYRVRDSGLPERAKGDGPSHQPDGVAVGTRPPETIGKGFDSFSSLLPQYGQRGALRAAARRSRCRSAASAFLQALPQNRMR